MSTIDGLVSSDLVDDVIAADAINDRILLLRRALEAVVAGRDPATVAEARMVADVARLPRPTGPCAESSTLHELRGSVSGPSNAFSDNTSA